MNWKYIFIAWPFIAFFFWLYMSKPNKLNMAIWRWLDKISENEVKMSKEWKNEHRY